MSDDRERKTQELGVALYGIYTLISRVCGLLPIPIKLPTFEDDVLHGQEMIKAVTRVIDLIEDEPMDELLQAGIWGGSLHWLSAAHLYSRFIETGEHVVGLEITINLVTAGDAIIEVARVVTEDQE
ncbi:hypothetical protein ACWCQN_13000 [Streptomyces sp. NPDC001984]